MLLVTTLQDVADKFGGCVIQFTNNIAMQTVVLHLVMEDIIKNC